MIYFSVIFIVSSILCFITAILNIIIHISNIIVIKHNHQIQDMNEKLANVYLESDNLRELNTQLAKEIVDIKRVRNDNKTI